MLTFKIIGERIKQRREETNLSQKDLESFLETKGIKMSRETISKIETGARAINSIEIKAICEILRVSPEDIMSEDEEKDLVSLFRSRGKISNESLNEIAEIQFFIKDLIVQRKINDGAIVLKRNCSAWRV